MPPRLRRRFFIILFRSELDLHDPAFRCFNSTQLDACECLSELSHNRTHLLHAGSELELLAVIVDGTERRDNSSCTAETTLCECTAHNFLKCNFTLIDLHAAIVFSNINE